LLTDISQNHPDPDLALILSAWPTLPEPVKASILMLVKAASTKQ
jgi:hypothetical protein